MSSETVTPTGEANARTERTVLHRTYAAEAQVEGRTVDVRLVPFGEVARVADPPDYTPYDEEWMPGVFDHQLRAPNRIHANYEHMAGPANIVGSLAGPSSSACRNSTRSERSPLLSMSGAIAGSFSPV